MNVGSRNRVAVIVAAFCFAMLSLVGAATAGTLQEEHEKNPELDKYIEKYGGTRLKEEDQKYHREQERQEKQKEEKKTEKDEDYGKKWLDRQLGR